MSLVYLKLNLSKQISQARFPSFLQRSVSRNLFPSLEERGHQDPTERLGANINVRAGLNNTCSHTFSVRVRWPDGWAGAVGRNTEGEVEGSLPGALRDENGGQGWLLSINHLDAEDEV